MNFEEMEQVGDSDVAIVGLAGRFPGALNVDAFWRNLRDGVESISVFDTEVAGSGYVGAGFVLEDVELFDAAFFDYSPREAEIMDIQQRVFLECAWEALENAGYDSLNYRGQVSVYASCSVNTYFLFNLFGNSELINLVGFDQIRHNNRIDNLATRVAYKLNLNGAAITVQTGCSSSLVATHLACQSLLNHECDLALAGGVSISALQKTGYVYHEGGILSPDGHCRAFDAAAQGTVNGNGVGIVVLKRLRDAIAQGDQIVAVIKGTAVNNDGQAKVGYTAPSVDGQAKVIAEALAVSGVHPETVSYVEAHGTGTILGDPIEVAALTKCFRASTHKPNFCAIGSVKTNIGHLDTAAGIAGLIKTVLALQNKQIPPSLHFTAPNPQIDFAHSPFYVNDKLCEWRSLTHPRRAGVSSFGIGGTNAHLILEEAPQVPTSGTSRRSQLLLLSAKTSSALETITANLARHLQHSKHLNLADVAYTLAVGRRSFAYRRIVVCDQTEDAMQVLQTQSPQRFSQYQECDRRPVVFMFPGQGSQYADMGRELYTSEPLFRQEVDYCCQQLEPLLGLDLRQLLYPSTADQAATQQLNQTAITQPALFVVEYALAKLLISWGICPSAAIGHSIGEYVAACLAGVFSLEDALALVAIRGKLMQQLPSGKMLAVFQSEAEVQPLLNDLAIAASNAPNLCVVSGAHAAIDALEHQLHAQGVECRLLHTSHAFHSQMLDSIVAPFEDLVAKFTLKAPQIPFISNVTGTWITTAQATDANYWAKHLRQTVRFTQGITELLKQPEYIFLEVGPGQTLSSLVKQHPQTRATQVISSVRHPQAHQSDVAFLLNAVGKLWLAGVEVNWDNFYNCERRYRVPLPTYPFERQKYWIEPQTNVAPPVVEQQIPQQNWFYVPVWKSIPFQFLATEPLTQKLSWLVFIDDWGLGTKLIQQLKQQGQNAIAVTVGEQFSKLSDDVYCINPQTRDDYDALIQDLQMSHQTPQAIAHLWSVASKINEPLDRGFWSLLFLAQALGQSVTDGVQIFCITNNTHNVTGEENLRPENAMAIAVAKVIAQEFPNITCRNIDIVIPATEYQALAAKLIAEFSSNSRELIVVYRGQHRWVQTFEPISLKENSSHQLRQRGVYLITGGLGGIGLALAEYLAQTVQAKLVLIGRTNFPKREAWEQWLRDRGEQDTISQKIIKLQTLENLGAEVLVKSVDVTDLEQMQSLKTQVLQQFGELHGVIHAAGVPSGGIIQLKTPQTAASILAPKVKGTLILDTIFQDQKLDFFVLCSSLTSILGGIGQVDYCAANAFLDAYTQTKINHKKTLTICINWCGWQQIGMLANTTVPEGLNKRHQQHIKQGLSPQEGIDIFSRILHNGFPQVIISKQNLFDQIHQSNTKLNLAAELPTLEEVTTSSKQLHPRPKIATDYISPHTEIEQTIAEIWQQILGLEKVGIHDNFFDLGGHSLLATQVISQLRKTFQIEIPLTSLFSESSTIANLAKTIEQLIIEKIENLSEAEVQRLLG